MTNTTKHPHLALIEKFYEKDLRQWIADGQAEHLRTFMTDDVIWRTPPGDCPPLAGEHVGFDQVIHDLAVIPLQEGELVAQCEAMFADDNIGLAVHVDELVNGKGGRHPVTLVVLFKFRDGKISEFTEMTYDPASMWAFIKGASFWSTQTS
jgi:ketosteroid isomerase-like protein